MKMTKMCSSQELRLLISGIDDLKKEELTDLIQCFPFQNLVNVSILDYESVRSYLQLLTKLSKMDIFYKNTQAVNHTLEFVFMNLLALENVYVDDILSSLLELLKCVLSTLKTIREYARDIAKERERMIDIITFTTKLKIFGKSHARRCTDILCDLLTASGPLPLTTSRNLAEISEIFKGLKAVHELAVICSIVLKKFTLSTEVFNVCMPWLLLYGPSFLEEKYEDDTTLQLLKVMNEFCTKYGCSKNKKRTLKNDLIQALGEFVVNLSKNSDRIISLSNKETLREESLKLFSFIFSQNRDENNREKETVVLNALLELPVDVKQWPLGKSNIFFYVCSFLVTHSRLIWRVQQVLSSMSSLIYSYDRFSVDLTLLKTLCYIYPILMVDLLNKTTLLLGDELLIIVSNWPCAFDKIHTYHLAQLVWILKRGECSHKKRILCQWLNRGEEMDTIRKAILQCNVGTILLDIIMDKNAEELVRDRATEMLHKLQDVTISKTVAMLIPATLHDESVLHRLITSNPGVPDDTELSFKICEFMSLILLTIRDERILKAACSYCKCLITDLKRETAVVPLFCQDMDNIKFLTIKVKYVSDETAVEILRLLKVLILVQKRNHNKIDGKVEVDLSQSLVGSRDKIEKCLDLLQFIVTSKDVLIKLDDSSVQNTSLNLFSLSRDASFSVRSLHCLTCILRIYGWLAQLHSISLFVEVQCSLQVDTIAGPQFIAFLSTWMKILKSNPDNVCLHYIPNKKTIANYIKRAEFISQSRATYLLKRLNDLKIYPGNFITKERGLAHLWIK